MASLYRMLQRHAHESPVYFYSIVIGAAGPVMALTVPPIRRRMGYEPADFVPTSYPIPQRKRRPVPAEFDDPPMEELTTKNPT